MLRETNVVQNKINPEKVLKESLYDQNIPKSTLHRIIKAPQGTVLYSLGPHKEDKRLTKRYILTTNKKTFE
jgi:hypothetical protein